MHLQTKKITAMGLLLALSVLLGYIEHLIPFFFGLPGAKIGLANLIVLLFIFSKSYTVKDVWLFQLVRIILCSILFANMFSFFYSLSGVVFSLTAMLFVKDKLQFGVIMTSVVGGIFHNVGQTVLASFLLSRYSFLYYLPGLLICGLLAGFCMGMLSNILIKRGIV